MAPAGCAKGEAPNFHFDKATAVEFKVTEHSRSFKCRIDGIPRPQFRSFATTKAGNKRVKLWNPSAPNRDSFAAAFKEAMKKANATFDTTKTHPTFVTVKFFFPRPKKHFLFNPQTGSMHLSASAPTFVTKSPDVDNCLKLTLDALQGIVCSNDCHVVEVTATKLFDHSHTIWDGQKPATGCTLVKVMQVDESKFDPSCGCHSCKQKKRMKKF